jgi:arginyl-tRNA synthetase
LNQDQYYHNMNIFTIFEDQITIIYQDLSDAGQVMAGADLSRVAVELPRDETHGDLACNVAMVLAKQVSAKPRDLAGLFAEKLALHKDVAQVEIAGPGFLNITLNEGRWGSEVATILADQNYGRSELGNGQAVNVEFVSANPTGPLHAAHARGAILGDVLANLLAFTGYDVTREYYVNDAGAQVDVLARSAQLRYREALGEDGVVIADGLYPGEYLKDVGAGLVERHADTLLALDEAEWLPLIRSFAIEQMMASIKADLVEMGIQMDVYSSERALVDSGTVSQSIDKLAEMDLVYRGVLEPPKGQLPEDWEPREQLLFKASEFGDDVDRPLQKSDGSWTYFASDVAYHMDKLSRTGGSMIDIWGADHGGYVKRMKAATEAISGQKNMLDVKLCQLVSLLDKGTPVKMSKRAGTFVTLKDVMDAVGADVMRFIMLTRRSDQTLEFDYARVTEKSRENPVFYVQYAHARASSVLRQAEGQPVMGAAAGRLVDIHEVRVIRQLASFPHMVKSAALSHEPHRIAFYLIDLASLFHGLWNAGRDNSELRFICDNDDELTSARLALVSATRGVISQGLSLMGITALEEM